MHSSSPPIPKQTVGKSFTVAISILGLVAVSQILAVGYAFFSRVKVDTVAESQPAQSMVPATGIEPTAPGDTSVATAPAETPSTSETEASRPPVRSGSGARVAGLIQQAKKFRDAGDMQAALVKLREADTLSLDDALVASEMAATYELMGLTNKAMDEWGRVFEMGESAGALYQLAKMKVVGDPAENAAAASVDAAIENASSDGLQPGSVLGLIDVRVIDQIDPEADKKLTLRVGLKARAGEKIDVRDVVIQVFFYDLLDREHIVQTNAQVSSQWTTVPADWSDDGIEILEVGYLQPKLPAELATDEPMESHEYLGYIVRVYYKGELEDVRADPVKLLTLFPPPLEVEN